MNKQNCPTNVGQFCLLLIFLEIGQCKINALINKLASAHIKLRGSGIYTGEFLR